MGLVSPAAGSVYQTSPPNFDRSSSGNTPFRYNVDTHASFKRPTPLRFFSRRRRGRQHIAQALLRGAQDQQQPASQRLKRHLPPFTLTLDPKQIDERQVARLMELAHHSPYAFTSPSTTEWAGASETQGISLGYSAWQIPIAGSARHERLLSEPGRFFEAVGSRDDHRGIFHQSAPSIEGGGTYQRVTGADSTSRFQPAQRETRQNTDIPLKKLRKAIDHSTVVVALLMKRKALDWDYMSGETSSGEDSGSESEGLFRIIPRANAEMRLVAFARASSDASLTAAIHDLIVHPDFQFSGLGKRVMQRMLRELQRYGTGDIAISCHPDLCPYFGALGFASDRMRTKMMMYTREPWSDARDQDAPDEREHLRWVPWGSKLLEISSENLLSPSKKQSLTEMLRNGSVRKGGPASSPKLLVKLSA